MICTDIAPPAYLIFSSAAPTLLYYSHFPAIIMSLFLGLFVFYKDRYSLINKILLSISVVFSLWAICSLIVWTNVDSNVIILIWSFFGILSAILGVLCLYFVYVFIGKRDASFVQKVIVGIIVIPVILLAPTKYNLDGFNLITCDCSGFEGKIFLYYYYSVVLLSFLVILSFGSFRYLKEKNKEFKKQIFWLVFGIEFFLFSFFITGFLASYLADKGIISDFGLEFYGLLSMVIFIGVLAYLIVKYKAFDIKLIGAQALVYSLVILIGSQFFFIQNNTNRILTGITLIIASGFGYVLIKTIKSDLQRKDELQYMADALAVSNDRLKKADNAKTEFISIASHQLRTPLTVIKGYVSLLVEGTFGDVSEDVKRVIKNIKISNDRLIELVEDLLNISRMESGRMEFKFAPTDVPELCTELFNSFGARDKENHNIEFKLDLPKDGIRNISTDRSKLREVISNLVDNAVKYTPSGWVKIKAFQKDSEILRIEISDSGIGIPATEMPYLFAKFSRGKDTGRLTAPGTGLGLHVSRSMVEALHGKVWAESEGDKKGSTFIIELPMESEESSAGAEKVRTEAPRIESSEPSPQETPQETKKQVPSEIVASDPVPQTEAPQEEKPAPMMIEPDAPKAGMPASQGEPEGRIIFNEPKRRNRIV